MVIKIKKKRKATKWRGNTTHGHGARKKWKKSGHHGGVGMAGTGKRADHKKSMIIKLFGNNYFGKQGITSRSTVRVINDVMNLDDLQRNIHSIKKKHEKNGVIELKRYKILGEGELKEKLKIKARAFSEGAKSKIEKAGGEAILFIEEIKPERKEKKSSEKAGKEEKEEKTSEKKKPVKKK